MALAGMHVEFGFVCPTYPAHGALKASEILATGTTSTNSVPATDLGNRGTWVIRMICSSSCYVAVGPSPDPTAEPRRHMPALTVLEVAANPGDFVRWTSD